MNLANLKRAGEIADGIKTLERQLSDLEKDDFFFLETLKPHSPDAEYAALKKAMKIGIERAIDGLRNEAATL